MSFDLPSGKSPSFIAYGAPETIPAPDGTATTGRPQIYVRWFDSIKIKEIKAGGRTGKGDTVGIMFDAKSVDFDNDFMAYLNPDDPTLDAIREAYNTGAGIQIALESVRKVKSKSSGDPIAKTTPIHALRGAKQDGSDGKMDASGDNIRNLVAMVDGMTTETINSDPREWRFLSKNRTGEIAPRGWRFVGDRDDWTKLGFVIENTGQGPTTGSLDGDSIAALAAAVAEHMGITSGGIHNSEIAREVRRGVFNEGKPWNARTSNGMVNLGSYLLAKNRAVFLEAFEITKDNAQADELTRRLLAITDQVQADTYGHGIAADRLAPSHAEAGRWVSFVLQQGAAEHYPMEAVNEEAEAEAQRIARDEWSAKVVATAIQYFGNAAQIAREYLGAQTPQVVKGEAVAEGGNAEGSPAAATDKPAAGPSAVEEDPAKVAQKELLRSLAQRMTAVWNDAAGLSALLVPIRDKGMTNAPVSIASIKGAPVINATFDVENQQGWSHGTVINFVNRRVSQLSGAEGTAQITSAPASAPTGQSQADTSTVAADGGENAAQAAPEGPQESQSAPAAASAYPDEVVAVIERLKIATAADMGGIFADAAAANLLDQRIAVKPVGRDIEFGTLGAVGYAETPLNQVITRMLENLGAAAAEEKQTAQEADAPAEPAVQAEAPTAAESNPEASAEPAQAPDAALNATGPAESAESADSDLPPEYVAPAEDAAVSPAQELADRIAGISDDVEALTKLKEEVIARGLGSEEITAGELQGGLIFFVQHSIDEAKKTLAKV